jgi:hypothetical protein
MLAATRAQRDGEHPGPAPGSVVGAPESVDAAPLGLLHGLHCRSAIGWRPSC